MKNDVTNIGNGGVGSIKAGSFALSTQSPGTYSLVVSHSLGYVPKRIMFYVGHNVSSSGSNFTASTSVGTTINDGSTITNYSSTNSSNYSAGANTAHITSNTECYQINALQSGSSFVESGSVTYVTDSTFTISRVVTSAQFAMTGYYTIE